MGNRISACGNRGQGLFLGLGKAGIVCQLWLMCSVRPFLLEIKLHSNRKWLYNI